MRLTAELSDYAMNRTPSEAFKPWWDNKAGFHAGAVGGETGVVWDVFLISRTSQNSQNKAPKRGLKDRFMFFALYSRASWLILDLFVCPNGVLPFCLSCLRWVSLEEHLRAV